MTKEELYKLIEEGREIEFNYDNKCFSITYGETSGKDVISFCEFYMESTEVIDFDSLLKIKRYGKTVEGMLLSCSESDIYIY